MSLIDREKLLRRVLHRIERLGYYHQVDVALIDLLTGDKAVKEIAEQYLVHPNALYKQMERLKKSEAQG